MPYNVKKLKEDYDKVYWISLTSPNVVIGAQNTLDGSLSFWSKLTDPGFEGTNTEIFILNEKVIFLVFGGS